MQFCTYLHCRLPRARCKTHGVKSVGASWAGKNSRFTLLFEALAIRVLKAARSVEEAHMLLKLNWRQTEIIKARVVHRGLSRRYQEFTPYIGIDEKQFRSEHLYISSFFNLEGGRVVDLVEECTEETCKSLIDLTLVESQKEHLLRLVEYLRPVEIRMKTNPILLEILKNLFFSI